jgi:hypothetical protein
MLIDVAISADRNVIKKTKKILKDKELNNRKTVYIERKNKGDTSSNWRDWNHFKIIKKIREHHTRKP